MLLDSGKVRVERDIEDKKQRVDKEVKRKKRQQIMFRQQLDQLVRDKQERIEREETDMHGREFCLNLENLKKLDL